MLIAVIILWIICAYLCVKVESILTGQKTWNERLLIALIGWPLVLPMIVITKHYTGLTRIDGKRTEAGYPDRWEY